MRRDTQAVLLLLLGGTLLKISITGTYVRYVKPGLLPLLVICGVVLLVIAGVSLWRVLRDQWVEPIEPVTPPAREQDEPSLRPDVTRSDATRPDAHQAREAYALHEGHPEEPSGALALPTQLIPVMTSRRTETQSREISDRQQDDQQDHPHDRGRVGWLLLLPALALLLFAPPAVGAFQASRNGTALGTARGVSEYAPLPEGDPVRVALLDYAARAVFDKGRSLQGRRVTLSGFVIPGPAGQSYLARMVVGCCAADARPVKIGLTGDVPVDLGPDQWIEVEGEYLNLADRDPVNAEIIPYVRVTTLRRIPAPELQYES